MKKAKILLLIPLCMSLFSGCNISDLTKYQPNQNSSSQKEPESTDDKVEDFFENVETTFTDNLTSVTLQTLYETCKKATVTVEVYTISSGSDASLYSTGSGFIAKESASYLYIYTNAHVTSVETSSSIKSVETEVILSDYTRYSATVLYTDPNEDVAVLRIDKPAIVNYLVASLGDSKDLKPGESVFAIGSPLGLEYASTITHGIVSGVNIETSMDNDEDGVDTMMYLIQTDTAINPGNSGGPLFNYNGEVVGINTLKILESSSGTAVEGMGFSIPINHFEHVAATLMKDRIYTRPTIGILTMSVAELSLSNRKEYNITIQHGLYIDEVTNSESPLKTNTIITHINNIPVYSFSDFAVELYTHDSSDTISITYCNVNGTNPTTVDVTLN